MSATLQSVHYHVGEDPALSPDTTAATLDDFPVAASSGGDDAPARSFTSNEGAARFYLDQLLQRDGRPAMAALVEPDRPDFVPALVVEAEQDLRPLGTHQVRFSQTHRDVPVFGARAVVELTGSRDLVSVTAQLDEVSGVEPVESLGRADALERVARYTGVGLPPGTAASGRLNYYKDDESGSWHLVWLFTGVPAQPPSDQDADDPEALAGHGWGRRPVPASYDYLVDAHDGQVLFSYSAVPTALPTPSRCTGTDEDDEEQTFFGQLVDPAGTACHLDDPLRAVRTFDLEFADIDDAPPLPASPVTAETSAFGATNRAAVSAHLNASRVQDFYKLVLQRDGIDDQGMTLISLVNVTAASMEPPPGLLNAFWYQRRMWYGQIERNGRLVSLSRYLDVIAHELTHGVIETTSDLVYATQSGALNESFADAAGIIVNNWYTAPEREDVTTWDWEIGPGLRNDGRPLRDFADPSKTGHPQHMDQFRHLRPGERPGPGNDQGWVHVNSNIHNKAVHNMLTATRDGAAVFGVQDVAVLTYLGMARLTPLATFPQALQSVLDVARTYFGGDADRTGKLAAIREAYARVGITSGDAIPQPEPSGTVPAARAAVPPGPLDATVTTR
jgi:bacillolysin